MTQFDLQDLKILSIDCTTLYSNIAVISGKQVLFEQSSLEKASHSVNLLADIDSALSRCGLKIHDIGLMGVTTGPGSFTGIRIGLSTVNSISFTLKIPVAGIDALSALARNCAFHEGFVFAGMDARKKEIYGALYRIKKGIFEEIIPPFVATPAVAAKIVRSGCCGSDAICSGDAFIKYEGIFAGTDGFITPPAYTHRVSASKVGFLVLERYENNRAASPVQPFYIRKSEAESRP
ncbi:MAG: tRNA (adenosine(37)-N6)-threonylcarbamoyltransferase complex dimerization subunit type 1 TsaB [Deltaproteobacteria bacterium]|nr:tRNA (adenosine(37)-N6)-threonylcarbamoyltransferase complex dimerization subunit type 1 TsaB [Deltaproteobacteria bacterium]